MIAFSNDQMDACPTIREKDLISCPQCGGEHEAKKGISSTGDDSGLFYYNCGESSYICGLGNKNIMELLRKNADEQH